jgi:hypothetical protein
MTATLSDKALPPLAHEWTAAEILELATASTAQPEPAWVPDYLDWPQLHAYLAEQFPELRYASTQTVPNVATAHIWLDPATGSWVQLTDPARPPTTIRRGGPRRLLYEQLICTICAWHHDVRPYLDSTTRSDAVRRQPRC